MQQIKFIKDHPSRKFKKGDLIDMPKENVEAWVSSGYAVLPNDSGEAVGNVEASTKVGEKSNESSGNGGKPQSKLSKNKKQKKKKNRNK